MKNIKTFEQYTSVNEELFGLEKNPKYTPVIAKYYKTYADQLLGMSKPTYKSTWGKTIDMSAVTAEDLELAKTLGNEFVWIKWDDKKFASKLDGKNSANVRLAYDYLKDRSDKQLAQSGAGGGGIT
jgi:hypothetical protein